MAEDASLTARVRALELQVGHVCLAFGRNHQAYTKAIGAIDGHIAVLRAVLNDINRGEVLTIKEGDFAGDIDWNAYYGFYQQHVEALDKAAESTEGPVSSIASTTEHLGGSNGCGTG